MKQAFSQGAGGRNGMKSKLLLCMSIEILCFLYVAMQIAKSETKVVSALVIFLIGLIIFTYAVIAASKPNNKIMDKDNFVKDYKIRIKKANIDIMKSMKIKEKFFIEQMQSINKEILRKYAENGNEDSGVILKLLFESRKKHAENNNIALEIKWNENNLQSKNLPCKNLQGKCKIDIWDMGDILLNLLDNAIEAVENNSEENRWIKLTGIIEDNYVFIEILNPYDGELKIVKGEIKTTKEDEKNHGMGLKIVRKAAEKYGMTMDVSVGDNIFGVRIAGH